MSDPLEHELYRGANVTYSILDESHAFPKVTPPPGPFDWRTLMVQPAEPSLASLYLDDMVRRLTSPAIPDAFRRKPVIEPWVWDRSFPTRDLKPFIEEQQRLVKLIAERQSIPLRLLDDSTPAPTPKPRRANPESDTMTDEATTPEPTAEVETPKPGDLTPEQINRGNTLGLATAILSNGGGIAGAFSGTRLPDRFVVDDLLDVSEYLRGGIITSRLGSGDRTVIDRFDPANPDPDEDYVEEHIKTRAAFARLADKVTENRVPIPFEDAFMVAIDRDAPDDELIGAVKEARKILKQLVTDRGL